MEELHIFGFQKTPRKIIVELKKTLTYRLQNICTSIILHDAFLPIPEDAYVLSRHQYKAKPFLNVLNACVPLGVHGLALINLDLYVPNLNFIFGVAQKGGNALVALPRLSPIFYGFSQDSSLFFQRVIKEVLHELGHVFGLDHCSNRCVMRFSNTLNDTDRKPETYCNECTQRLLRIR